jgi:uncharacterized membrane protein
MKQWLCTMFIALMIACSDSGERPVLPPANTVIPNPVLQKDAKCPNGTWLNYENFGEAFFVKYCTHCHARDLTGASRIGAPDAINLDRPEDVATWRAKILKVAATGGNNSMPPSGQTPSQERARLAEWLNCGGPADRDRLQSDNESN